MLEYQIKEQQNNYVPLGYIEVRNPIVEEIEEFYRERTLYMSFHNSHEDCDNARYRRFREKQREEARQEREKRKRERENQPPVIKETAQLLDDVISFIKGD